VSETARELLTGWGRTAPSAAEVDRVRTRDELVQAVRRAPERGVIARGLGRSYGDAAQAAGGLVVDTTGLDRVLEFEVSSGRVRAEAGLSLDRLMRLFLPFGWFVPVTPGTRFVTLGGALAADIHGKNHHVHGSFADHVLGFSLVTADGERREVTPDGAPDVFWATAGGMGLTGLIETVELQLLPVTTSRMLVDTERAEDLDDLLDRLATGDHRYLYSVAWIDAATTGAGMGRGVLTRGRHAELEELPERAARDPLHFAPSTRLGAPDLFPSRTLNRFTVAAFNELWFRRAPRSRRDEVQDLAAFFHPLDGVADWNRIYGPRGFLQYQFVVPPDRTDTVRRTVEAISGSSMASFLAVLKRFGPGNAGMLSFPFEGWTLALDFPNVPGLERLFDQLDELVLDAGGRLYLAKDAQLAPGDLGRMYPRLDAFRAVRRELDPDRRFCSDLARRLGL
jgi:decaprenylphospho-beta-D-ribofuranose 2-oxidase